jgi:hypothetical protein
MQSKPKSYVNPWETKTVILQSYLPRFTNPHPTESVLHPSINSLIGSRPTPMAMDCGGQNKSYAQHTSLPHSEKNNMMVLSTHNIHVYKHSRTLIQRSLSFNSLITSRPTPIDIWIVSGQLGLIASPWKNNIIILIESWVAKILEASSNELCHLVLSEVLVGHPYRCGLWWTVSVAL